MCADVFFFFYFILVPSVVHFCSVSHFQHITRRSNIPTSSSFWISTSFILFFSALSPVRGQGKEGPGLGGGGGGGGGGWGEGGGGGGGGEGWRGGGNWLLQASREQDRWLDTGQSYTAKGCKRAMGKPCVCHEGTHALSHTDPHICTPLHP